MRVQSLGQEDPLEERMAIQSSILAWRISGTEETGGLQSIGSQRVRHEWSNLAPTPCFLQFPIISCMVSSLVATHSVPALNEFSIFPLPNWKGLPLLRTWIWVLLCEKGREGNGTLLQYSCLENPMDGGAWKAPVCGVAKSQARLSNFTFTFHFHALEEEMATHSSVLAWRIPGTEEPSGLPSMGSHRVGHDWSNLAASEKGMLSAIPVNKECCQSFHIYRIKSSTTVAASPAPWYTLRGIQDGEKQEAFCALDTGFRYWRCISKEQFQQAQSLASPHTQKSTKIINLRCLIFLTSSNTLIFD